MRTPAHDTALTLSALTGFGPFGGSVDWSTYVGREPLASDGPVNCVTVYDTGGAQGILKDLRNSSLQVRVRSSDYNSGWQKANEAYEALVNDLQSATEDATILTWVAISDVTFIGRDDGERALFTVNFNMLRDGAAA